MQVKKINEGEHYVATTSNYADADKVRSYTEVVVLDTDTGDRAMEEAREADKAVMAKADAEHEATLAKIDSPATVERMRKQRAYSRRQYRAHVVRVLEAKKISKLVEVKFKGGHRDGEVAHIPAKFILRTVADEQARRVKANAEAKEHAEQARKARAAKRKRDERTDAVAEQLNELGIKTYTRSGIGPNALELSADAVDRLGELLDATKGEGTQLQWITRKALDIPES